MADGEWSRIRSLQPVPGWMQGRGGQPEAYCHRAVLDAIRYLGAARCVQHDLRVQRNPNQRGVEH